MEKIIKESAQRTLELLRECHDKQIPYSEGPFQDIEIDVAHTPLKSRQFFLNHPYFIILNKLKSLLIREAYANLIGATVDRQRNLVKDGRTYAVRTQRDIPGCVERFKDIPAFCPSADYLVCYDELAEMFVTYDRTGKLLSCIEYDSPESWKEINALRGNKSWFRK